MRFNFQKIHFGKLQIKANKFPIKIKKVHQAPLFQTLNHNAISLTDPKNFINTINTNRVFLLNPNAILLKATGELLNSSRTLSLNSFTGVFFLTCAKSSQKVVVSLKGQ